MKLPESLHVRAAVIAAMVAASALTLRGSSAQHRAHLSRDLVSHVTRHATATARVIVRGGDQDIDDAAARYGLRVVRRLEGGAVLAATGDQLDRLAGDARFDSI